MNDPVEETIKTYDSMADEYKKRYQDYGDQNTMKPLLDLFIESLTAKNPDVLDVGTGAGFDAKYLSEHGCNVTGIDLSEGLMKVAKEIAPKVNFIKADMRNLSFNNDYFDGIWASASILHIPKQEIQNVLYKLNRILKKDGVILISIKQGVGEEFIINKGKDNLEGAKRFFSFYSKDEFESLLNITNFKIIKYREDQNRNNVFMNFLCRKLK